MKKILSINTSCFGSTGKIMINLMRLASDDGFQVFACSPDLKKDKAPLFSDVKTYRIKKYPSLFVSLLLNRVTGLDGVGNIFSTIKLCNYIKKNKIDLIHLHNLHTGYFNLSFLFRFIKKKRIKVVWTLHDCWGFTGRCPYFSAMDCQKWKNGCHKCKYPLIYYPRTYINRSSTMLKLKKKWFSNVENMVIVTPSVWLKQLVGESFLSQYKTKVINNGINLTLFKPTKSSFKEIHGISNKIIVLGVALGWEERKGLDVFIKLSKELPAHYQIVLVGTDDNIDKQLPNNIISIHRTNSQDELAGIYTSASVFLNPTIEDNYPTVNMEALACGTPVLTYKTGGSPEIIDETCGSVVDCGDYESIKKELIRICETKPYSSSACVSRASSFNMYDKFDSYIFLYNEMISDNYEK